MSLLPVLRCPCAFVRRSSFSRLYSLGIAVIKTVNKSSIPQKEIRVTAQYVKHKKQSKSDKKNNKKGKIPFPLEFLDRLADWRHFLRAEIDAVNKQIQESISVCSHRELMEQGTALMDLSFSSESMHVLYGHVVDLEVSESARAYVSKFRPGMPLALCTESNIENKRECLLLSSSENTVQVALRYSGLFRPVRPSSESKFILIPSTEKSTFQSIKDFFDDMKKIRKYPGFNSLLFAFRFKPIPIVNQDRKLRCAEDLNEEQKQAVNAVMNPKRPFVLIQGPPGTGKTAVVTEIIMQAVEAKQKVLVCAPSNLAVDNILDRIKDRAKVLRWGVTSPMMEEEVKSHHLYDALNFSGKEVNALCEGEMKKDVRSKYFRKKGSMTSLKDIIQKDVLADKQVLFCTVTSGNVRIAWENNFRPDLVIIDEAAQAMECSTWIPVLMAKRFVLVGDHCQLGAGIRSDEAMAGGLGTSLMESLHKKFGSAINRTLCVQYRMNEKIMKWSSDYFYESQLRAHESVANQTLSDISDISVDSVLNEPLLMIDTCSSHKQHFTVEERHKNSYRNTGEAKAVVTFVKHLLKCGIPGHDIGVISPYSAQVQLIRDELGEEMVNTVDGFQGQERQVIVMSLVRNNYKGIIGFLNDARRLNVAVTRARRQFLLIGSSRMMEEAPHLRSLLEAIRNYGKILRLKHIASLQ